MTVEEKEALDMADQILQEKSSKQDKIFWQDFKSILQKIINKPMTIKEFQILQREYEHKRKGHTVDINKMPLTKYSLKKTKLVKPAKKLTKTTHIGTPQIIELEPAVKKQVDDTNGITKLIVDYLKVIYNSSSIRRVSSEGKWRPGIGFIRSENKGMSDIEGIVNGRFLSLELKVGKDKQQPSQIKRQKQVEADGGIYWLCKWKDFETFQQECETIIGKPYTIYNEVK